MRRSLRLIAVTFMLAMLSSCSATKLAYDNIEWLVNWKSGDYVSLTREQKRWLIEEIRAHRNWHCSSELPRYQTLIGQLQPGLAGDAIQPEYLIEQIPEIEPAIDRVLQQIAPTVATLLSQLSQEQIEELKANLAKQQEDLHSRFAAPDEATQSSQRTERLEKRLKPWLGRLSREQRNRISQWSDQMHGQNRVWLENRQFWLEQFTAALAHRQEPGFDQRIVSLLTDRQQFWTDESRQRTEINTALAADMLADVLQMASSRQTQRMSGRLETLRGDLAQLECNQPSTAQHSIQ